MNEVQAYEYDGKLFRTKEEVQEYKDKCIEEEVQKAAYYSDYNKEDVIPVIAIIDFIKKVPKEKLIEILEKISIG